MRIITAILLLFLVLLQHRLWFGKNSLPDYYDLKKDVARQVQTNKKLQERNKILFADIADLQSGVEAIEESARNELGMIKQDETFFRIIPAQHNQSKHNQPKQRKPLP